MAPKVSSAKAQLSYPLYACDFDPYNPDFLLVAGGGGSSATGVPNKISLIDTSTRTELKEVVDIELARDEDSVTSLAVAESSATSLIAFAGINSSAYDQSAGRNEHLRSFRLGLPARKRKADGSTVEGDAEKSSAYALDTQALGRSALFKPPTGSKSETYQRVLRFSPTQIPGEPRLAAVASGLAADNEILVFHPRPTPGINDLVSRVELGSKEAEDLDMVANDGEKGGYMLAYCTNNEVVLQQLPITSTPSPPRTIFRATDISSSLPSSQQPKFRAIRFLSSHLLLILRNKPSRTGADLLLIRISTDGTQARMVLRKVLNKAIKAAVSLDVCPLTASGDDKQFVIAVGGIPGDNASIEVLTLDRFEDTRVGTFRSYAYLKDVHIGPLTRLVLSNFIGPNLPVTGDVGPQSIRLASVGVDKSVVVHYLPLRPLPTTGTRSPRYVLTLPGRSEAAENTFSIFIAVIVIGLVAFLLQVFTEIRGVSSPVLGASNWFSPRMREVLGQPSMLAKHAKSAVMSDIPVAADSMTGELKRSMEHAKSAVPSDVPVAAHSMADKLKRSMEHAKSAVTSDVPIAANSMADKLRRSTEHAKSAVTSDVPVAAHSMADELKRSMDDISSTLAAAVASATNGLKDLVEHNSKLETPKAIIVREESSGAISTEVIHSDADVVKQETLRRWEELSESQKKSWKQKLIDAGHWAERQGENVLQGVFFSELAGAVGEMIGGG